VAIPGFSQAQVPQRSKLAAAAGIEAGAQAAATTHITDHQHFELRRCSDGLWENASRPPLAGPYHCWTAWTEDLINTNATGGLNALLNCWWGASSCPANWYIGLVGSSDTFAAGDTMSSHSGWTENATYSNATRPALTIGAASAGSTSNSASVAAFNINGTTTIYGAFLATNSTINGTTGTLWGGATFASSRAVLSGDTLNVTITLTAS